MVTQSSSPAERWGALAELSDDQRIAAMREVLADVLKLDDAARATAVEAMVQAEYALPDEQLRPFTVSRLRAWLAIAEDDMDAAKTLAHDYDAAFEKLPGAMAMHRSATVQTVARTDLTADEVAGLFELIPSIVRQVPRAQPKTTVYEKPERRQKPFWKFW